MGFLGDLYLAHDKAHPPEVADDLQALLAGCDHVLAPLSGSARLARLVGKGVCSSPAVAASVLGTLTLL